MSAVRFSIFSRYPLHIRAPCSRWRNDRRTPYLEMTFFDMRLCRDNRDSLRGERPSSRRNHRANNSCRANAKTRPQSATCAARHNRCHCRIHRIHFFHILQFLYHKTLIYCHITPYPFHSRTTPAYSSSLFICGRIPAPAFGRHSSLQKTPVCHLPQAANRTRSFSVPAR